MEEKPTKNFSVLIILAILILLVVVGIFIYRDRQAEERFAPATTSNEEMMEATPGEIASPSGIVKEFTIDGSNYAFAPNSITVDKGDTVKITFKDEDGLHNLSIDGYNLSTATLSTGGSSMLEFIADKAGTFEYFCNVDSHREKGMTGTLVVK